MRYRQSMSHELLAGFTSGRLTVVKRAPTKYANGGAMYECICTCGSTVTVVSTRIRHRRTQSCGCISKEDTSVGVRTRIHGHTAGRKRSPLYTAWTNMMNRCYRKDNPNYADYGGRGISVHLPWHTFDNFRRDVGERPEGLTLDRFPNNDGNYEPGNIRWATSKQQCETRRPRRWGKKPANP